MYTQRSKYWPAYTWKIQTSCSKNIKDKLSGEVTISPKDFKEVYIYIFDKINASFYHLQRLKENQEVAVRIGQAMAKIKPPGTEGLVGIAGVSYEPIGYEYESFLIKIKVALDLIATLVAKSFDRKEDDITTLLNNIKFRKIIKTTLQDEVYTFLKSKEFEKMFNNFKNPTKDKKSKRNFATHLGSLPVGTINIPINNPGVVPTLSRAYDPNQKKPYFPSSDSPDLIKFCEDQFYQTCDLLIGVLSFVVNKELKPGSKGSVYEQKR